MSDNNAGFKALGHKVTQFERLETFPAPENSVVVKLTSDEVTGLCPVTGQPDFYVVTIEYAPDLKCVESKTVKLYLQQFREQGIFCEALADKILEDFATALEPNWIKVTVKQKSRGGVSIEAVSRLGEEYY